MCLGVSFGISGRSEQISLCCKLHNLSCHTIFRWNLRIMCLIMPWRIFRPTQHQNLCISLLYLSDVLLFRSQQHLPISLPIWLFRRFQYRNMCWAMPTNHSSIRRSICQPMCRSMPTLPWNLWLHRYQRIQDMRCELHQRPVCWPCFEALCIFL